MYGYKTTNHHKEYSWAFETTVSSENINATSRWFVMNLETGETISLGEADSLFMADDAYYKDGERIYLAH